MGVWSGGQTFRIDGSCNGSTLCPVSKAFTRESDNTGETPVVRRQLPPGTKNLVTRQGADRLRLKLESLVQERQALASRSRETEGDERTQRQRIDSVIHNLQDVLSSIVVADPPIDQSRAGFGGTVTVMYPDGHQETFRIVGVDEADPERGSISWLSPLAKALLSNRAGDRVPFRGEELKIIDLTYSS